MLYPKIGIRPVIDGRWGGVRESLENQTMRMAENAAKLISENLKYPDGTPVQCVIGCTTIGGGAEAARVAEQFSTQNVTATLSVTPCWCYGTETFDMDPNTIKAVWASMAPSAPARCIWLRFWQHTPSAVCLLSPFMAMTCRKPTMIRFPMTWPRKSCALPVVLLPQAG